MRVTLVRRRKSKQNQRHDGRRYLAAAIVTPWQKPLSVRPAYVRQQIGPLNPQLYAINPTQVSYLLLHHLQALNGLG